MPWFWVDDGFAYHHKTVRAGNSAVGLWTRAGSWAARYLSDGFIPEEVVPSIGTLKQAERLVSVGLWIPVDNGFQFHQWDEEGRNQSRADVLARRRRDADKKRRQRGKVPPESESSQVDDACPQGTPAGVPGMSRGDSRPSPPLPPSPKTSPNGDVSTSGASAPSDFDRFWSVYPRRTGKGAAEKAWAKAVKSADAQRLVDAAALFAAAREGHDPKFTPHPATWLNQKRWEDEDQPPLRLVSGGYQPYQNPADPSAYYEDF